MKTELLNSSSLTKPTSGNPLKDDFRLFLYAIWKHLNLPDPTPIQYDIAWNLQYGPKRLVIEAFRGVGKSWVTSAFVIWLLYKDPQLNIMVVSASKDRADQFSTFTLRLINEVPFLAHLRPDESRGQRSSKIAFDVGPAGAAHAPSVKSVGITGQLTGSRADVIIADDIEVPNNSATQAMRDHLSELIKEFSPILKPEPGPGETRMEPRIIYLGTPQTEQSIYNLLPARGYTIMVWPARYPTEKQRARYGDRLAPIVREAVLADPSLEGKPTCIRFSEDVLLENLTEYGAAGFALQFMLDTSLSDAEKYPLKVADLIVMDLDREKAPLELSWGSDKTLIVEDVPNVAFNGDRYHRPFMVTQDPKQWHKYQSIVMAIDPSGRGTDETGYAIVARLFARLFLLDAGGFAGGYSEATLTQIAETAKRFSVTNVVIEPNFGDGMYNQLLQPFLNRIHPGCGLEETDRSQAQKEARIIDTLEPVISNHRLVVDRGLIERDYKSTLSRPTEQQMKYRLFYQMTRLTRDRGAIHKDDRIDALSLAVHHHTAAMAQDNDKALAATKAAALDAELKRFMQNALGRPISGPSVYKRSV